MSYKYKGFDYWAEEHYVLKVVTGSYEQCMNIFKTDQLSFPTMLFGTHVYSKKESGGKCELVIRRFKTEELCKKHLEFPPTYVREGKVL